MTRNAHFAIKICDQAQPNRIESFAKACDLSARETMLLALARLRDAGEKPVEMSADTLLFLLKKYGELVKERYVLTRRPT